MISAKLGCQRQTGGTVALQALTCRAARQGAGCALAGAQSGQKTGQKTGHRTGHIDGQKLTDTEPNRML